jgi:uncharacterized protein YndB with AHSA1/START domain
MSDAKPDLVATRIASQPVEATLSNDAGRWVLRMTRELTHPVGRVWPKLTEPDQLALWSPVVPDRTLDSTGPATSREAPDAPVVDAEVLRCDPPRELVHRWGDQLLRWTLTPTPTGSRLTLEHTFDDPSQQGSYGGGWHICLAVLGAVLDGYRVDRVVGERALAYGWSELRDRYQAVPV